jgi:hypothetical protein
VGLGLIVAWVIHQVFGLFGIEVPWWLETPGAIAVAGTLFSLFDKYFWSWPIFSRLGIIDFPDLHGRWVGELKSSYEAKNAEKRTLKAALEIQQTASDICINLFTEESHSTSLDASLKKNPSGIFELRYGYENHPEPFTVDTMKIHFGSVMLCYFPDINELRGEYFTSRERATHGTMRFKYKGKRLHGRFD